MSKNTATKKVVIVRKSRAPKFSFPVGVPVNVKVKGERVMMKHVTLAPVPDDSSAVKVLTGRRGRPAILPVANIERVRAL